MCSCLLIGPTDAGKTLLLKRLKNYNSSNKADLSQETHATIATVGVNIVNLAAGKRQEVVVKELGGCMAPIWHKYYKKATLLVYVVDMSNRFQISSSCIQFLSLIKSPHLAKSSVLILLNKIDLPATMTRKEVDCLWRLDDITRHTTQKVEVLEISAQTGQGLEDVVKWLHNQAK
ncbi:hypothetical protein ScPMuIL_004306 [Solemya velum]